VHSVYSDGKLTPEQLAAGARAAGLDFIATTEHNTADAHGAWRAHSGDDLLVILGEEVTTGTGHWLALGIQPGQLIDWRYRVRDGMVGRHLDEVHHAGGLCVAAHPYAPYPSGMFMYPYRGFDVVEVWNGLWTSDLRDSHHRRSRGCACRPNIRSGRARNHMAARRGLQERQAT
jgi:predicted metal-dependent phosphoesterase TrpH